MARILVPVPDRDFDLTEVAVPWKLLDEAKHQVIFATEGGERGPSPACDPRLVDGVLFGQLGAKPEPKRFYDELRRATAFERPLAWSELDPTDFDALVLPGGHAPGMKQ